MKISEIHRNFKIELDKESNSGYPSFLPEEIDYWVNSAILRFTKTRISGLNTHAAGFQSNQKRTDDLKGLVVTTTYFDIDYNNESRSYSMDYPEDYMYMLGESAYIYSSDKCWPKTINGNPEIKRTDVMEATIENIDSKLSNSLSDHRLNRGKARPIRLQSDNKIYLYTDGNYFVDKYLMTYISMPAKVNAYSVISGEFSTSASYAKGDVVSMAGKNYICTSPSTGSFDPAKFSIVKDISSVNHTDYDLFMDSVMYEIVILAVKLALENISEPRYQSYSQEAQLAE